MPFRLRIPRKIHEELLAQARAEQPNECCGILAGDVEDGVGHVVCAYPLPNALADPQRYNADPRALIRAHKEMQQCETEMLAVYHSHPTTPAVPSATDHAQWGHGKKVVCLIVTLTRDPPQMRGWWMSDEGHREAEWEVGE
jgi:proteasome lid subunit RPN8/RPN11